MSKVGEGPGTPRAVIHQRILDVAASRPEASLEELADEVSGATPELVERVLEEYGDPGDTDDNQSESDISDGSSDAADEDTTMTQNGQSATANGSTAPGESTASDDEPTDEQPPTDPDSLTEKQRATLRAVHDNLDASQGDIADILDVSRATVSRRLSDVPGFDWSDRRAFTTALFGAPDQSDDGGTTDESSTEADADADGPATDAQSPSPAVAETLDDIDERLAALETEVADAADATPAETDGDGLPPELAHKVVHAAMESDRVSEDEELELLKSLLR